MLFSQLVNSVCLAEDSFLSAEQVFKDDQNEIIKAKGSVQIQKGKIRATADSLVFDAKINQVKLKGNIKILSETDDLIFAEESSSIIQHSQSCPLLTFSITITPTLSFLS